MTSPPPLPGSQPPPVPPPAVASAPPPIPAAPGESPKASRKKARGQARIQRTGDEPASMDLLEEAFHLLRSTPSRAWAEWLLGAIPWYAAWVWLICHLSWFRVSGLELLAVAVELVPLFILLRATQARFCGYLCGQLDPSSGPRPVRASIAEAATLGGPLGAIQLASLLVLIPFPIVLTYAHHRLLLVGRVDGPGTPAERHAIAHRESSRWAFTAAWSWVTLFGLGLFLALAFMVGTLFLAGMISTLLGLPQFFGDSTFSLATRGVIRTLFWLSALAALAILDPWWKATVVALHHRGHGRITGADLRAELTFIRRQRERLPGTRRTVPALLLAGLLCAVLPGALDASPERDIQVQGAPRMGADSWERSTREVVSADTYTWRLPPRSVVAGDARESRILNWLASVHDWFSDKIDKVRTFLRNLWNRLFPEETRRTPDFTPPEDRTAAVPWLLGITLLVVATVALALVFWMRHNRAPSTIQAAALATPPPDLHAQDIDPGSRPWQEWLRLARNEAAAGRWRPALRALFLAHLSRLGDEGLLALTLAKTNRAYELELTRRSPPGDPRPARFREHRRTFEAVWYGRREAEPALVETWLDEFESGGLTP